MLTGTRSHVAGPRTRYSSTVQARRPRVLRVHRLKATSSSPSAISKAPVLDMQERLVFLKEDLMHLFDSQGIDSSAYDTVVDFKDPITKFSDLSGYLFNIKMLKQAFNPTFILHDIKQTSEYDITTRWTMEMEFSLTSGTPIKQFFDPKLIFTGTSIYVFNPENGKIFRHIDTWDSIKNQDYFSVEAFADFFGQLLTSKAPMSTPKYEILKRMAGYQIRRYESFPSVQTPTGTAAGQQAGLQAMSSLKAYFAGANKTGTICASTSPIFTASTGAVMAMVAGLDSNGSSSSAPAPNVPELRVGTGGGFVCAVKPLSAALPPSALPAQEAAGLIKAMGKDGLKVEGAPQWMLACYEGDQSTPSRYEVMVPLKEFSLW